MRRCLLLCILLFPALARADYVSDYREGVAAAERQQWDKVDTLMRSAIAQEPNPKPRIRLYGQVYVPYVPRFYLGLSAWSRKDCASAITLLEDAATTGVARGQKLEERQQLMLRSCRAQMTRATSPTTAAAPTPAAATPGTSTATTPARGNPAQPATTPAASASKPPPAVAARPTPAVAPPKPVAATPPPAAPAFDVARAQAAQARLDRIDAALAAAKRTLADPALAAERGEWQRQSDPLAAQAARARTTLNGAIQARNQTAVAAIEAQLASLQPAADKLAQGLDAAQARSALAAQVRARLQPLVAAYLVGDYARVAQWADDQALAAVPQAYAQALLLRAAAQFELYVLGGERDLAQFDRIGEDIRSARRLSAGIKPSERAFPPRFRSLFASTR